MHHKLFFQNACEVRQTFFFFFFALVDLYECKVYKSDNLNLNY